MGHRRRRAPGPQSPAGALLDHRLRTVRKLCVDQGIRGGGRRQGRPLHAGDLHRPTGRRRSDVRGRAAGQRRRRSSRLQRRARRAHGPRDHRPRPAPRRDAAPGTHAGRLLRHDALAGPAATGKRAGPATRRATRPPTGAAVQQGRPLDQRFDDHATSAARARRCARDHRRPALERRRRGHRPLPRGVLRRVPPADDGRMGPDPARRPQHRV